MMHGSPIITSSYLFVFYCPSAFFLSCSLLLFLLPLFSSHSQKSIIIGRPRRIYSSSIRSENDFFFFFSPQKPLLNPQTGRTRRRARCCCCCHCPAVCPARRVCVLSRRAWQGAAVVQLQQQVAVRTIKFWKGGNLIGVKGEDKRGREGKKKGRGQFY